MCTVLLPPGVNPIAINKYININLIASLCLTQQGVPSFVQKLFPTAEPSSAEMY